MKKILDLLEQKVQWIVLAAGVAYVLFMAWTYLISSPVKVEVAGKTLAPGEIDNEILTNVAQDLQVKMKATGLPANIPQAEHYVENFKSEMSYGGKKPDPNTNAYVFLISGSARLPEELQRIGSDGSFTPQPGGLTQAPPADGTSAAPAPSAPAPMAQAGGAGGGPVEAMPALPAPTLTHTLTGLSLVNPSAPPTSGTPAPENVPGVDKNWVTVRYEIDPAALAKAWDQAKIPNAAAVTCFLQVVLTRQEMMPNGSWGKETTIKPPAMLNISQFPGENIAMPAKYEFNNWARSHQPEILQPTFYAVLKGDPWYIPGETAPASQIQTPNFRPENYISASPEELMKLTSEQRRAVAQARQQQQQRNRGTGATVRPAAPAGGGAGNGIDFAPLDPDRPVHYVLQDPIDVIDVIDVPVDQPATPTRVNVATGAGVGKFLIPTTDFDPRKWATERKQPIIGWAHDDTAAPDATYRYKVKYLIKNPVFGNKLQVKDAALADNLSVVSPDSGWSSPVDVTSTVSFFVAGPPREGGTVPIEVFRWKGGGQNKHIFNVGVGDTIGTAVGDVDYTTGWTVVDFVKNPAINDWVVILMDQRGTIRRRTSESDRKEPRYQRMKEQVAAGAAAAATP